nr:sn1-specific diacylglycerol lipase beta isoform X2 [Ipomoea trifida]
MEREASSPLHYAHAGVVEAAHDLYMEVEGNSVDEVADACKEFITSVDPFCTNTSLSFQMGIEWTLYLYQRSEKRGALISILRTPSGTSSESWKHGGCTSFSVLDNGKGIEVKHN